MHVLPVEKVLKATDHEVAQLLQQVHLEAADDVDANDDGRKVFGVYLLTCPLCPTAGKAVIAVPALLNSSECILFSCCYSFREFGVSNSVNVCRKTE